MKHKLLFQPKPDITAFELAQLMPFMMGKPSDAQWESLPENVKRHAVSPESLNPVTDQLQDEAKTDQSNGKFASFIKTLRQRFL